MANPKRTRLLNSKKKDGGPILYWMNRDMRLHDNWALLHAQELATERNTSVIVAYNLVPNYLGGGMRQWYFKIKALEELSKEAEMHGIPFFLYIDHSAKDSAKGILEIAHKYTVGMIVTDFCPLRTSRKWVDEVRKKAECAVVGVDAHNIVPVWIASPKQEFAARTMRPKLYKLLPEFLEEFPAIRKQKSDVNAETINWSELLQLKGIQPVPAKVDWCEPGEKAGKKALDLFIDEKLQRFAELRNDPNADGQSNLSPYLHYGNLSTQRIALEVMKAAKLSPKSLINEQKNGSNDGTSAESFLEELIVRRELSDNYCFYNENYDNFAGAPEWSHKVLEQSHLDKREFVYTKKQFEEGKTHDELWNAAQLEMVKRGKMSGYMRMYWAKKILEWTKTPEEAIETAVYLNDKYELDGREPNGYVGIMWSICGLHDRAWFPRPIFGTVRYMARSGCEKKFDVEKYIEKWTK